MRSSKTCLTHWTYITLLIFSVACQQPEPGTAPDSAQSEPSVEIQTGAFTKEIGGRAIHYVVSGSGPPLMVLPNSWGISVSALQELFGGLEQNFTVVYFDPRGMGGSGLAEEDLDRSMAAVRTDLENLRQHLDLYPVRVIGWSNGAQNLILHAAEYRQTLSHAIFVHGAPRFSPEDTELIVAEYPELTERFGEVFAELRELDIPTADKNSRWKEFVVETWFPHLFADPEAGRQLLEQIFSDTELSWDHNLYANQEIAGGYDSRRRLASITAKGLVIAGAHDMVPPERIEEIDLGIPDSEFVVFEQSGHFAPVEEPELFVETVTSFLLDRNPMLDESGTSEE